MGHRIISVVRLGLCCLVFGCWPAAGSAVESGIHTVVLTHEGRERRSLVFVPAVALANPSESRPLLLALHGSGGDGAISNATAAPAE